MNPTNIDWSPKSLIAALGNAEAQARDAQGRGDSNSLCHWQEMAEIYRSMARRHSIRIER